MGKLYKYGTHDGIKYNPRRTQFRLCCICGQPFFDIPPRSKKQVCSDECDKIRKNTVYNPEHNYKYSNKHNANKVYQPPKTEEERIARMAAWKKWYNNLTYEQRQKYNHKKKQGATKKEDTCESVRSELEALGLR